VILVANHVKNRKTKGVFLLLKGFFALKKVIILTYIYLEQKIEIIRGKFFGKNVTSRMGVNEKICGEGSTGVIETYDTYFFGIRTSSGNTRTKCI
jgi:hypothetical protein